MQGDALAGGSSDARSSRRRRDAAGGPRADRFAGGQGENVHRRVLLQGALGPSAGIPETLQEEPPAAAQENPGGRKDRGDRNRGAALSRSRGGPLGFPR